MALAGIKTYFGFDDPSIPEVAKGRRRTITYAAFLVFVLAVAAADASDWVVGGLEFSFTNDAPSLTRKFHVGLQQFAQTQSSPFTASGDSLVSTCQYDLNAYISEINAAAVYPNCTNGARNPWCGANPLSTKTFSATYGLLVFAAFVQIVAWLGMLAVQLGIPGVADGKYTLNVIALTMAGGAFFIFVAVANFAAAPVKNEFCSAFDPDANYNTMPCGYGDGFNVGVSAAVFGVLQLVGFFAWMPRSGGATRYEFAAGAASMAKGGYEPVGEATSDAAAPVISASGYQDFGGSTTL